MKDPQLKKKLAEILDPSVDPSTLSTKADLKDPELKDCIQEYNPEPMPGPMPEEFLPVIARLVFVINPEIGELSYEEQ